MENLLEEASASKKQISALRLELALAEYSQKLENVPLIYNIPFLTVTLSDADMDTLRQLADRFRQRYRSGIAVLAGIKDNRPNIVVAVSEDLVARGINAVDLVRYIASPLGGGGGGRPTLAQAGGKDASQLEQVLNSLWNWLKDRLV